MTSHLVIVCNIPADFHSADLRNFFSDFVESERFHCFHFRHRPQSEVIQLKSANANNKYLTVNPLCCILKCANLREKVDIIKKYHFQHWTDSQENILSKRCVILAVKPDENIESMVTPTVSVSPAKIEVVLAKDKVDNLMELKPPLLMPNGNVGTPTKHFSGLISTCQLPSKIIGKLGLRFTKSKPKRKYGSVPFNYGTRREESDDRLDDEEEEWDRHEALHNDVTEQERNKERIFEEEMEVVWEKGGPGIVWYTDAQVWREAEGDFDEQTADDWDVDFSIYHEEGGGDKVTFHSRSIQNMLLIVVILIAGRPRCSRDEEE